MSSNIKDIVKKWNLPKKIWKESFRTKNKIYNPPYGIDCEKECYLGPSYWNNYPDKNYQYIYNDFGFRDNINYTLFLKENTDKKVNICIGDSVTINMSNSFENSWPYQLRHLLNEPTLNISLSLLLFENYMDAFIKCLENFNIDKVFILYSFFEMFPYGDTSILLNPSEFENSIKLLRENYIIPNTNYQFVPSVFMNDENKKSVLNYFPNAFDFMQYFKRDWSLIDINLTMSSEFLKDQYKKLNYSHLVSYEAFVNEMKYNSKNILNLYKDEFTKSLIKDYINQKFILLLTRGRDGMHNSKYINKAIAQYFYEKSKIIIT